MLINRINMLRNIGRFTALSATSGTQGDFEKLNVIYAPNACGKSTLCDVFRSLSTGNPAYILGRKKLGSTTQPEIILSMTGGQTARFQNGQWHDHNQCPPIHVYDDRFVYENVFVGHHISVDQRRNLYGLVIGDQAIALQQAVDFAQEQLNTANSVLNTTQTDLSRLIPIGYTIDFFRNLTSLEDVDTRIIKATSALKAAEQTKSKADAIRARRMLSVLPIAEVPETLKTVLDSTFDTATLAAEDKVKTHLAKCSEGLPISWAKQGYESQIGTVCPHCGRDMQGLEILEEYRSFFSGEMQTQEQLRESTKSTVQIAFGETAQNELRQILISHETEKEWWKDAVEHDISLPNIGTPEDIIALLQSVFHAIDSALVRKQASPGSKIRLTDEESSLVDAWNEKAEELHSYNEALHMVNVDLKSHQGSAGELDLTPLQQQLAYFIAIKKRYEQETINAYSAYDAAINQKAAAQQAKQQANEELREQSSQLFERYGSRINELLTQFGVDFRIVNDGVTFKGGPPSGQLVIELSGQRVSATSNSASDPAQTSFSNTLCGGDRSALALAFFLAKVEIAPDIDKSVVILDDPYHNQDRSRRQCTIERIHYLTGLAEQCIVFSHDLDFARSVERLSGIQKKTFVIDPLIDPATIKAQQLPPLPSQAYIKNYQLLFSFSENPSDYLQHLKEVADTLRIILEEYLRLKFPMVWKENDWLGDMISKIRESQPEMPLFHCQSLVEELGRINTYSRSFHHGGTGTVSDTQDIRELKVYVDRTLKIIHNGGEL